MRNVLYSLEVFGVPGGWRLEATYITLKAARLMRDTPYYGCVRTRIRKWEPK